MKLKDQFISANNDNTGADVGPVVQDAHIGIRSRKRTLIILSVVVLILAVASTALYKVMAKPAPLPAFVQAQANASPTAAVTAAKPDQPSQPTVEQNPVAPIPTQAQPSPAPTVPVTAVAANTAATGPAAPIIPDVQAATNAVTATIQAPAVQPKPVVAAAPYLPEQEKNGIEKAKPAPHKVATKGSKAVRIQGSHTAQPKAIVQPPEEKQAAKETMRAPVEETVSEEPIFLYR